MWRWDVLEKLVDQHRWTRGAEIGVNDGATFFRLLDACFDLTMIAVDAWAADTQWTEAKRRDMTRVGEKFLARAEKYGPRAVILHGLSVEQAEWVEDASLDFAFIDADHSTPAVLADIAAWAPKVKAAGMVLGHDINMDSVRLAVVGVYGDNWRVYPNNVWGTVKP